MDERDRPSRSGTQFAADAARSARAVARIIRAALAGGPHGAVMASVKEFLPFLLKLAVGILAVLILLPMLIFTAMPNIFFGYGSSTEDDIVDMTAKALEIGGVYLSMEDLENNRMDAIVTSLAAKYEEDGVTIDNIEVINHMEEEDLLWLIAIHSVAHEQDLNTMSAEDILNFNISTVAYIPSIFSLVTGEGSEQTASTTLRVEFEKLDPDEIMERLGFDGEAKTWAGALYEVLEGSGALEKYQDLFEAYKPDYSGDSSYSGAYDRSESSDNAIDISGFVSPNTKNNLDLAAYAIQAYENGWGYVWGTYGNVLTESLFKYKLEQYPEGVGNYEDFIRANWLGRRTADCVGLIKGYGWLDAEDLTIDYGANGMPDYGADQMYAAAKEHGADYGAMDTMPDIPGLAVWKRGHIGVYIGNGKVVEAMGTKYGVVMTELDDRNWTGWCEIPFIDYISEE